MIIIRYFDAADRLVLEQQVGDPYTPETVAAWTAFLQEYLEELEAPAVFVRFDIQECGRPPR